VVGGGGGWVVRGGCGGGVCLLNGGLKLFECFVYVLYVDWPSGSLLGELVSGNTALGYLRGFI